MSSLLKGREMLTESRRGPSVSENPLLLRPPQGYGLRPRHRAGRTDRDEQLFRSPDLGKSLDEFRLGSDIPAKLLLASPITVEQTTLGERGKVLGTPGRSVLRVETFTERFEPLVHALDVLVRLFLGDHVLDDRKLQGASAGCGFGWERSGGGWGIGSLGGWVGQVCVFWAIATTDPIPIGSFTTSEEVDGQ